MKKRKFSITLLTENEKKEYSLLGEYDQENRTIHYKESTELLTNVTLDLNKKTLIRENKDYLLKYTFLEKQETENNIQVKELNQNIILKIKTKKFKVTDNKVEIVYTILDSKETIYYQITF